MNELGIRVVIAMRGQMALHQAGHTAADPDAGQRRPRGEHGVPAKCYKEER